MIIATIPDARVVTDKPYVREAGTSKVTKIRVASNPTKKADRSPARFLNAECWGGLGDQLAKLSKGDLVSLSGEMKLDKYTDKNGTERQDDVLVVTHFRVMKSESFFGRGDGTGTDVPEPPAPNDATDDDLPF